jgi:hypothetical protein
MRARPGSSCNMNEHTQRVPRPHRAHRHGETASARTASRNRLQLRGYEQRAQWCSRRMNTDASPAPSAKKSTTAASLRRRAGAQRKYGKARATNRGRKVTSSTHGQEGHTRAAAAAPPHATSHTRTRRRTRQPFTGQCMSDSCSTPSGTVIIVVWDPHVIQSISRHDGEVHMLNATVSASMTRG